MTAAVVTGLVGAFLFVCALYSRASALAKEREKTAAANEGREAALLACKGLQQKNDDFMKAREVLRGIEWDLLERLRTVEKDNARLRFELQKYETVGQKIGRLGALP